MPLGHMLIAVWATRSSAIGATAIVLTLLAGIAAFLLRNRWPWAAKLTRHPFAKYVVLSVVAHIVLAIWAYTARLFESPVPAAGPRSSSWSSARKWATPPTIHHNRGTSLPRTSWPLLHRNR